MADYLLVTRADGGLSVVHLLQGEQFAAAELAKWEQSAAEEWLPVASARVAIDPVFPDKAYRAGWVDDGTAIVVSQERLDQLAAAALTELRAKAKELFQAMEQSARRDRALVLVTLDEVNLLRSWLTDFKTAVAGAGTLAALKTAVAALPNTPQRTAAQAKNAVLARIDTAEAD